MEVIGLVLTVIGCIVMFVGGIWFLIEAFHSGLMWGIGCLFCGGIVGLIWLVTHWQDGKAPFGLQILGMVIYFVGVACGGNNFLIGLQH